MINSMKWYRRRSDPVRAFQYLDSMRINGNLPEGVTIVCMGREDVPVYRTNGLEVILNNGDWVVFCNGNITFMEDGEFQSTYELDRKEIRV